MRKIFIFVAFVVMCGASYANASKGTIDGVTLNVSLADVKKQLGAPEKESMSEPNACNGDARDMILQYDGLLVVLSEDAKGGYTVSSIDVTSPARSLNGVRIGDSVDAVIKAFGKADLAEDQLSYDFGEAGGGQAYEFTIHDGKVSHIKLNSYMC